MSSPCVSAYIGTACGVFTEGYRAQQKFELEIGAHNKTTALYIETDGAEAQVVAGQQITIDIGSGKVTFTEIVPAHELREGQRQFTKLLGGSDKSDEVYLATSEGQLTSLSVSAKECVIFARSDGFPQRYILLNGRPFPGVQQAELTCDARIGAPVLSVRTVLLPCEKPRMGFGEVFEGADRVVKKF